MKFISLFNSRVLSVLLADCDSEQYGDNCNEACHCAEHQPCNPVDGQCPGGKCQDGFEGLSCSVATTKHGE